MAIELLCRKVGMTQIFDEAGVCLPVTVLAAEPNVVVQRKTDEKDGYTALQLGAGERRANLFNKPARGHFEKANTAPRRVLKESRVEAEEADGYEVGQEITCAIFEAGQVFVNDWLSGTVEQPFGGYKQSGYGREKGIEALHHYTQLKSVTIKL